MRVHVHVPVPVPLPVHVRVRVHTIICTCQMYICACMHDVLCVQLPAAEGRADILTAATRKMPLAADVDLAAVAADARCRGFSGADLASLAREAAVGALRSCGEAETPVVCARDFDRALSVVLPSVSPKDEKAYAQIGKKLRQSRASQVGSATAASSAAPTGGADAAGAPAVDAAGAAPPAVVPSS